MQLSKLSQKLQLSKLSQKLFGKEQKSNSYSASDGNTLSFDLLYQLSYMSVIASAGVPRDKIFERSAQLPCASAKYFDKVNLVCQRLKYDYAQACSIVGESTKVKEIKGLLLRFNSSLVAGEPEADLMAREAEAQAKSYDNEYGGKIETLKMWTDAYVSLILSAVLIIIMGIVSTMIWETPLLFILGMVTTAIITTMLGVWMIYLVSPREYIVLRRAGSREQKLVQKLFKLLIPVALAVLISLWLAGYSLGWLFIAAAVLIFPIGFISTLDGNKITQKDIEIGAFLASLGGVCAAIGTTVKDAMSRLDLNATNTLRCEAKRLYDRLSVGIGARLCWQRFIEETGSELANRSVSMFYDAIDLGGEPERAGYHASLFVSKITTLQAKRKTVSSPFRWLCIAMHASAIALLIFITEVVASFGRLVEVSQEAMTGGAGNIPVTSFSVFNSSGLKLMQSVILPLAIVFTVANALAPSISDGGSRYKILYNLGITMFITGVSMLSLPMLAELLFSSIVQP